MNKFYLLLIVLVIGGGLFFYCNEIRQMMPGAVVQGTSTGDVILGVGQKGIVDGLTLTFNALVQDSRCPVDVVCIQAGAVNSNVTLATANKTETRNLPSDEVPYTFDGYRISIVKIAPDRENKKEVPSNAYVLTFHVSR